MPWPLVGREAEFARVSARLASGGGLLVVGEPGVGKTRLARAGLDAAYARGARTEWVAGAAGASGVPLAAIAHLVPDADDVDAARLIRSASRSLSAPTYGSMVIGVDDAHNLDAASAAVLHHAVVTGNASMLATARRGAPLPEPIDTLVRDGRLERLDLAPLSNSDVAALLSAALEGPVDGGTVNTVFTASEGNPMLVRELVAGGLETAALALRHGLWSWEGPLAAPRLTDLVEARLGRLSEVERSAVEALAMGSPLTLDVAETLVGPEILATLDRRELVDVRVDGGRTVVQLTHPLYSEVLRATLSPLRRRAIQRDLAAAFVGCPPLSHGDVLRVVAWRLDAGEPNDVGHLQVAARRALGASEFELAERIARGAVDAGDDESGVILGMALAGQGRIDEAHEVLTGAGDMSELASRAIDIFFYGSRTTSAADAVQRVQRVITDTDSWPEGSEPLVEAAQAGVLLLGGAVREACKVAERVVASPDASMVAQLRALLVAAPGAYIDGRTSDSLTYARYGLRLLERGTTGTSNATEALAELDAKPLLVASESVACQYAGRLAEARLIAEAAYRDAVVENSVPGRGLFSLTLGLVEYAQGRVPDAGRLCQEAVTLLRRAPAVYFVWALGALAQAAAILGDERTATEALAEAEQQRSETFQVFDSELRLGGAWVLALRGDMEGAQREALDAAKLGADAGQAGFAARAAHDAARLGAEGPAADLLAGLLPHVDGELFPAFARHARAMAARDATALVDCADVFERLGWRLLAAEALASASRLLDGEQARAAAARARTLSAECGDVRTPALLALARAPVLTEREDEVARLAAGGLSNRDIATRLHISVRTVDNHLHRVYEKLGIAGRDELRQTLG